MFASGNDPGEDIDDTGKKDRREGQESLGKMQGDGIQRFCGGKPLTRGGGAPHLLELKDKEVGA